MYDVIIIGAGTAGMTAALYTARAGKKVLLLEGQNYGGQIINTPAIENYPGIKSISGFDFATDLYEQVKALNVKILFEKAIKILNVNDKKQVQTNENTYDGKAIIVATGSKYRPLGLEKEDDLIGKGISYCATCDGAFYRGKKVAVVGGGNTALEDALVLSEYCEAVYVVHRRKEFRGEEQLQKRLLEKDNVILMLESTVAALNGTDRLESVIIQNTQNYEKTTLEVDGVFVAIGQMPENECFSEVLNLDEMGYVIAGEGCRTNADGIFVAGDCRTKQVRQLTTAVSDGAIAALAACAYID